MAEVLGRYSKLSATEVRITKVRAVAEQELRKVPWQSPELRGVTRVRRLVATEISGIAADYEAGMGCVLLARKYGISDNTVLVHLKAAGVEIRQRGKLTADDLEEIRRLRSEGWSQQRIADQFGVTRAAVSLRLGSQLK